jgi:hypothetical protein
MSQQRTIWTKEDDNKVRELYLSGKKFYEIATELNRKQRFIRNSIENAVISEIDSGLSQNEALTRYRMTESHYNSAIQRRQRNEQNQLERQEIKSMSKEQRSEFYKQKRTTRSAKKSQGLIEQIPSDLTVQELAVSVANLVQVLNKSGVKAQLQIRGNTIRFRTLHEN